MMDRTTAPTAAAAGPLSADELERIDAYWRASNYLSVGQIYLLDNPLLREPLRVEHIKPRLLGHWGTTPGLNFIYVHLNRVIRARDLDAIYVTGPGHGGPAVVAQAYLEGTSSELYPALTPDEEGMRHLFHQFSFPGGVGSHATPETPGSINEGGELGYSLMHAFGAVFDNPGLVAFCVVGDGEAETGPLATSWHSNKFLNPATDGAVVPILHLNGYKIANPTVLARIAPDELTALFEGYGYRPYLVEGDDLVLATWRGPAPTEHVRIPIGYGLCGWAAEHGESIVVNDVSKEDRYLQCFSHTKSEIVVRVMHNGEVLGEIDVDGDELNNYGEEDKLLLEEVANRLGERIVARRG
jgi:xylulose-5-phosphate/fructose-6-phosphate phosphoketolase